MEQAPKTERIGLPKVGEQVRLKAGIDRSHLSKLASNLMPDTEYTVVLIQHHDEGAVAWLGPKDVTEGQIADFEPGMPGSEQVYPITVDLIENVQ